MKQIVISLSIPDELYERMEQDRQTGIADARLHNAIVETIQRHYLPRPEALANAPEGRRPGYYGRMPDSAETGWGEEWSSRWSDLKAERSARTRRDTVAPTAPDPDRRKK
ncbi:MAG: hypothetical protein JWQ88_646 [Rhodoferax sp.]|nr:hypothetical protein [Rhodoferax sp.]